MIRPAFFTLFLEDKIIFIFIWYGIVVRSLPSAILLKYMYAIFLLLYDEHGRLKKLMCMLLDAWDVEDVIFYEIIVLSSVMLMTECVMFYCSLKMRIHPC